MASIHKHLKANYHHIPHTLNAIPNATPNATSNPPYFTAKDLATIYGFPTANTSVNSVIGVLSFGGGLYGTLAANGILTNGDVQKYWAFVGIPANQMPKVIISLVGGATNAPSNSATVENTLDVSIIGACCPNPNLTIILYIFPNTYLFTQSLPVALAGITVSSVLYKPTILSISWGLSEQFIIGTSEATNVNTILQAATQNGINICAASGDNGSTDGSTSGTLYTDFPSSCPYLTAVGGTSLFCPNVQYDGQTVETVWNNGVQGGSISATGGGISRIYAKPSYQNVVSTLSSNYRCVPDIALDADPNTGIVIYVNNQLVGKYGGTSIAAPLFASYLSLINIKTFVNPILYNLDVSNASCFHDIVSGTNYNNSSTTATKSYSATVGYDCCSGLGSISGSLLASTILNLPPQLATSITVLPITATLTIGQTLSPTATVLPSNTVNKVVNWTSSSPANATVNLTTGLITGVLAGSAIITATTTDGSNKTATISITVNAVPQLATSISINKTTTNITLLRTQTLTLTANVLPFNTTNKTITWISSNIRIATINSSSGLLSGVSAGSAIITARTTDGSNKSSSVQVRIR